MNSSPLGKPGPRRTLRGNALRFVGIALGLTLFVAALLQLFPHGRMLLSKPSSPAASPPNKTPSIPPKQSAAPKLSIPTSLIEKVHQSVVQIESEGPAGHRLVGTGFVVTREGDIATSYHVAMELGDGIIRFFDGRTFEIAGYSAVSPENDLALLRTKLLPSDLVPLPLANVSTSLKSALPIIAAGHPEGVPFLLSQGTLHQAVSSNRLSPSAKRFVATLTQQSANPLWIQHTAALSDGSSGGPLLTLQGEVLGINTWVDPQSGYSYALAAAPLAKLIATVSADNKQAISLTPLLTLASPSVKKNHLLWQTSGETLKQLRLQARAFQFTPRAQQDYQVMQRLALGTTIAHHKELLLADEDQQVALDGLAREADQTLAELEKQKWTDVGIVTLLNEFAAPDLSQPMCGQFFLATVQKQVEGKGEQALLVRLAGFEQFALLPLTGKTPSPAIGSQILVLGANLDGKSIPFGENPLALKMAHVITPAILLPLAP